MVCGFHGCFTLRKEHRSHSTLSNHRPAKGGAVLITSTDYRSVNKAIECEDEMHGSLLVLMAIQM